jgi:hypothetical protein
LSQTAGFPEAVRAVARALDETGRPWMFIGGVAVIALGVPRLTVDVDATITAEGVDPEELIARLSGHAIAPRIPDAAGFARHRNVVLLRHGSSQVDVDVSLAFLPFELDALRSSLAVDWVGLRIPVARPQDLVVYKLVAARPRDLDDVEKLLLLHREQIDVARVRRIMAEFAQALEDEERPRVLDAMLRRLGLWR